MRIFIFISAIALSACSAPNGKSFGQNMQDLSAAMGGGSDDQHCTGYGFKPGTDAFANCKLQMQISRQNAPVPHIYNCTTMGNQTTCN